MSVVAILQARSSSSRLPQKVLRPILGKPMLERQIERVLRSQAIEKLIVATSDDPSDDLLVELCQRLNVACFRGSLEDVLDRFYNAAALHKPKHVVRLTGDCPLIDHQVIDKVISAHIQSGADYTSNVNPPTYPDGLDVEVMTFTSLETAWRFATLQSDREHVTSYIRKPEASFHIENVKNDVDLSHFRWTVDELADFEFVTKVYTCLYRLNSHFDTQEILELIENQPDLLAINQGYIRNEGYEQSLLKDKH
ncbi:spore coat protein [Vibrio ponticus]|uniref:Spore coat protein n=1 Tax=Vibrio ponticus TaxID=265668 RepID=A0A3N3DUV5_9VIBR|nr:glycosyltransferase family protein [Vibrio ponticus]ROV58149.1 spore coat protein [Vibrio ponticus]